MLQIPSNCTGCHACVSICPQKCIVMEDTVEGFKFPVLNIAECIQCHQCEDVCPILHEQEKSQHTQAYAMKNRNEAERKYSTSGGVFPLLAEYVLDHGGIVFGAAYDENLEVRHIAVSDRSKLFLLQGAKYVQSIIGTAFIEVEKELKAGRSVLFSGTPCQCAGLKLFLGKSYNNLLLVDLICHGIPSPKVWQAYIDYRSLKENNGQRPININMRSKVSGWSRYGYSVEFDYGDNHITRIHNSRDLFMKAFVGNICLRVSCSDCVTKGVERCTDFTLGDYWGIWDQHPEFDDNQGTSVVFVHSEKGETILKQLKEKMEYLPVDQEDAYRENCSLVMSSKTHDKRQEFLEKITAEDFENFVANYFPSRVSGKGGMFKIIKEKMKKLIS